MRAPLFAGDSALQASQPGTGPAQRAWRVLFAQHLVTIAGRGDHEGVQAAVHPHPATRIA
jgi:hypothetical protein